MSIKVGLYQMDERSAGRLRIVFKMVYKDQCVISEIADADSVIINVDQNNPNQLLAEFKQAYPGKPAIILSDKPITIEGIKCMTRPFKLPELLEALKHTANNKLFAVHSASTIDSTRQTADLLLKKTSMQNNNNSAKASQQSLIDNVKNSHQTVIDNKDIYYQPGNFLQGKVTAAIAKANSSNKSIFLRCWSHRWIVISPSSGCLVENIKERQLISLGLINIDSDVVFREEPFTEEQMLAMSETPTKEVKVTSIQKFIWNIAVRTARGRIPEGTSVNDLYVLERWPNLTRLMKIKNAMRISAFWLNQPQSIHDIASKLVIPIEDVYTYFSAASAIGLIKEAKRREDNLLKPDVAKARQDKKGLFSAILKKLGSLSHTFDEQAPDNQEDRGQ